MWWKRTAVPWNFGLANRIRFNLGSFLLILLAFMAGGCGCHEGLSGREEERKAVREAEGKEEERAGKEEEKERREEVEKAAGLYRDLYEKAAEEHTLGRLETMRDIIRRLSLCIEPGAFPGGKCRTNMVCR